MVNFRKLMYKYEVKLQQFKNLEREKILLAANLYPE